MLYRYSEVFRTCLLATDLALVSAAWLVARAGGAATAASPAENLAALAVILPLWLMRFRARRLYEPQRIGSMLREAGAVARATAEGVLLLVAIGFFVRPGLVSRMEIALFALLALVSVVSLRMLGRVALRAARRRGYNLRYLLVVGGGRAAEEVIERIHAHPEAGLHVRGVLVDGASRPGRSVAGVPVLGNLTRIKEVLRGDRVDQVILALRPDQGVELEKVLSALDDEVVTVRLVPDLLRVMTLRSSVETLDGLPMINLRETPMVGWSAVAKRGVDVAVAGALLLAAAPLMALVALATWLDSGRPIFFAQARMGLDGRVFRMFKFRTMVVGADERDVPVWTRPRDPRRTRFGGLLRRTSLDELPQLWNVLRGEMSLVGPRPERPVFIEQFRREVPGYMLRHKVKAGVTGWAQVCGWRGDTSLHRRIEHDIYYIQNWSLGLDLRILLLTLWRIWTDRNAY